MFAGDVSDCVADLLLSEMDTKRRRQMDRWGMEQAETEPS